MTATPRSGLAALQSHLQGYPRTVRFRLTALYTSLFLAAGASLLAITYVLVDHSTGIALFMTGRNGTRVAVTGMSSRLLRPGHRPAALTSAQWQLAHQLGAQAAAQHAMDLHQLLTKSGVALAIMAGLAIVLGWLIAGRVLRPLRVMTAATQRITERNLHQRLALAGPADELKNLADTIDGLLARLETAFDAQRHFVANASHELRTPLTYDRALLEVALADPAASAAELRATCEELLASGEQQERLIEALLTLASSERHLDRHEEFDLAAIAERVVSARHRDAEQAGLEIGLALQAAPAVGNPDLAERMVSNLVENAIRHNVPGGRLDVATRTSDAQAVLAVSNTGPVVPQDQLDRLIQPFQRLGADRAGHPDGHGLGLYIVQAIATAHDAELSLQQRPGGGLDVMVRFGTVTRGPAGPPARPRPRGSACPGRAG
jgi:signal transduction histidine kinase